MLPGIAALAGFLNDAKAVVFTASDSVSFTSATTRTFSAISFGDPSGSRKVVVAAAVLSSAFTQLEATIGGVSATRYEKRTFNNVDFAFFVADVPAGSTGDVVLEWGVSGTAAAIGVWAIYGTDSAVPSDTAGTTANEATEVTDTVTAVAGGFVIAAAASTEDSSYSWTNATSSFTETVSTTLSLSGAVASNTSAGSLAITATAGNTATRIFLGVLAY